MAIHDDEGEMKGPPYIQHPERHVDPAKAHRYPTFRNVAKVIEQASVVPRCIVAEEAVVRDYAHVADACKLYDRALVCGHASVVDDCTLLHDAVVADHAKLEWAVNLLDDAVVMGHAYVRSSTLRQGAIIFGQASLLSCMIWRSKIYGHASIWHLDVTKSHICGDVEFHLAINENVKVDGIHWWKNIP